MATARGGGRRGTEEKTNDRGGACGLHRKKVVLRESWTRSPVKSVTLLHGRGVLLGQHANERNSEVYEIDRQHHYSKCVFGFLV